MTLYDGSGSPLPQKQEEVPGAPLSSWIGATVAGLADVAGTIAFAGDISFGWRVAWTALCGAVFVASMADVLRMTRSRGRIAAALCFVGFVVALTTTHLRARYESEYPRDSYAVMIDCYRTLESTTDGDISTLYLVAASGQSMAFIVPSTVVQDLNTSLPGLVAKCMVTNTNDKPLFLVSLTLDLTDRPPFGEASPVGSKSRATTIALRQVQPGNQLAEVFYVANGDDGPIEGKFQVNGSARLGNGEIRTIQVAGQNLTLSLSPARESTRVLSVISESLLSALRRRGREDVLKAIEGATPVASPSAGTRH